MAFSGLFDANPDEQQIYRLAQTHPSTITIPGMAHEEISIGLAYDTFNEYEVTAKMCCEMIEVRLGRRTRM